MEDLNTEGNVLQLKNITAGYGNAFRLKNINLNIRQGDFTGIVGPNGAGKTTLLKCISGDLPACAGTFHLTGKPFNRMRLKERAQHMAVVSQRPDLGFINVRDYVMMGRLPYRSGLERLNNEKNNRIVDDYMKKSGVWIYRDQPVDKLSGGEQQMVAITRALVQEPDLLLLDEPTAHLDIAHQAQILDFIQQLNEEMNLSVVMVVHDLNLAAEYCTHLLLMQNGTVCAEGTPGEVLTRQQVKTVYETDVIVTENPLSGRPFVFPVSRKMLKNRHTETKRYEKESTITYEETIT